MKISVIVTTYNSPEYLLRVLDGLAVQSRLPDEVLVADDGSGHETTLAVKRFGLGSSFPLKHVWHEDRGFRAAKIRNEAIKASTGDYIVILDGDCVPNRHFVSDHETLAEKGYFVQGKRVLVGKEASQGFDAGDANSGTRLLSLLLSGKISNSHHIVRLPFLPARKGVWLRGIKSCNMGFFREDLLAVNGFNESFTNWGREDTELAVRLFRYGLRRKEHFFIAVCYHLWHPSYPRENLMESERILEKTMKSTEYFCPNGIVKRDA